MSWIRSPLWICHHLRRRHRRRFLFRLAFGEIRSADPKPPARSPLAPGRPDPGPPAPGPLAPPGPLARRNPDVAYAFCDVYGGVYACVWSSVRRGCACVFCVCVSSSVSFFRGRRPPPRHHPSDTQKQHY